MKPDQNHFNSRVGKRSLASLCGRWIWFIPAILLAAFTGLSGLRAQDVIAPTQTNEVSQAEDLIAADSQTAEAADELAETNTVAETNQTADLGPDARARRLRRRSQNRARPNAQAGADVRGSVGTNSGPAALDYSAFRLVADRNIFDPNRSPRSTRTSTQPKTVPSFTLVGTMSYEKGVFAFFDGTSSDYKKVLKPEETIAGYKVVAITTDSVKLMLNTNVLELSFGAQMRRRDDGAWERSAGSTSYAASSAAASQSEAAPSGAESDIIKKMMLRREKE